jgi:putative ABC transport system permease protein
MNFTDIIALALRNLRQSKLRTALTVIGVVVGVAAIITMVSFGIGLQRNIIQQAFGKLDAFTVITVLGADADDLLALSEGRTALDEEEAAASPEASPTATATPGNEREAQFRRPQSVLDDEAVTLIRRLNGVTSAVPLVSFGSYVRFDGRTRFVNVAGAQAGTEPRFRNVLAGSGFSNENAYEAVVSETFLNAFSAEAMRRRRARRGGPPPGGPFQTMPDKTDVERQQAAQAVIGKEVTVLSQPLGTEGTGSIFGIPLLAPSPNQNNESNNKSGNDDSQLEKIRLRIVGVLKSESSINFGPSGNANFYIPLAQAIRLREANLTPMERMGDSLMGQAGYRAVEVRVADPSKIKPVSELVNKMGFRAFSVTSQLEEIERIFLIVNSSLALIGGIALLVASFGISNTMIMAIRERTREIGIMKAIGGSDGEIMRIFFVEASLIGLLGGTLGVIAGWGIDRIANRLANDYIVRQAGQSFRLVEFFSIPWYLLGGAILFAVVISLIAAIYPALRAAKVDPIKALRYE